MKLTRRGMLAGMLVAPLAGKALAVIEKPKTSSAIEPYVRPVITIDAPAGSKLIHLTLRNPYANATGTKAFLDSKEVARCFEADEVMGWVRFYDGYLDEYDNPGTTQMYGKVHIEFGLLPGETQEQIRQEALEYAKWGMGYACPRATRQGR